MTLKSLDLFSGVGGITLALKGIAEPVGYCDIKTESREVLSNRIKDGKLPPAPIFHDVTTLQRKDIKGKVDMIVGGWPCQDLSSMGLKKGLQGSRSGLIREVYRLTDELNPKAIFLENVPDILNNGIQSIVNAFVAKRMYVMRWVVVPASSVGAHHTRNRFFCLLHKPNWRPVFHGLDAYKPFRFAVEPPRMVLPTDPDACLRTKRIEMMGNSVVPDAVRAAFITLMSGFTAIPSRKLLKETSVLKLEKVDLEKMYQLPRKNAKYPRWGMATHINGKVCVFGLKRAFIPVMRHPQLELVMDPFVYGPPMGVRRRRHPGMRGFISPRVKKLVYQTSWATPRLISCASNILTERVLKDLPTQVRYEVETPAELRAGQIHPLFTEWLMGYPRNWTKLCTSKKSQVDNKQLIMVH